MMIYRPGLSVHCEQLTSTILCLKAPSSPPLGGRCFVGVKSMPLAPSKLLPRRPTSRAALLWAACSRLHRRAGRGSTEFVAHARRSKAKFHYTHCGPRSARKCQCESHRISTSMLAQKRLAVIAIVAVTHCVNASVNTNMSPFRVGTCRIARLASSVADSSRLIGIGASYIALWLPG